MSSHQTKSGAWFCVIRDPETKKQKKVWFGRGSVAMRDALLFNSKHSKQKTDNFTQEAKIKIIEMYENPEFTIADIVDKLFAEVGIPLKFDNIREMIKGSMFKRKNGIKPSLRFKILDRDNSTCRKCGRKAPDVTIHVDHIIPLSRGGMTEERNLQALCEECNMGKRNSPCNHIS